MNDENDGQITNDSAAGGEIVPNVDREQLKHFVTMIKSAEQQVGEHIIAALRDDENVAVLTTVVVGTDGGQRIVSLGIDPQMLGEVQRLLVEAGDTRQEEIPCLGFHCFLKPKGGKEAGDAAET